MHYWIRASSSDFSGTLPQPRSGHTAVNIGKSKIVVFGGLVDKKFLSDITVYDTDNKLWFQPECTGCGTDGDVGPSPRAFHIAVSIDCHMFIFGGRSGSKRLGDFWVLDTDIWQWSELTSFGDLPSPRDFAAASAIGNRKIVMHGGWDDKKWLSDVYVLDTISLEWMELSVSGPLPPPRCGHTATMVEKRLLVYGGRGSGGPIMGDLWALKGLIEEESETPGWTQLKLPGQAPSARCGHTVTSGGHYLLLFGGHGTGGWLSRYDVYHNDCVVLDRVSVQWKRLPTTNEPPPARAYHSVTYTGSRYLLFGGFDGKTTFGELWWLVPEVAMPPRRAVGRGRGCRGLPIPNASSQEVTVQHGDFPDEVPPVVPVPEGLVIPNQFMREFAVAMAEASRGMAAPREAQGDHDIEALIEFRRMDPPKFNGEGDSLAANHWLFEVRKILDMLRIQENQLRISFASYQFIGEANERWSAIIEARRDALRASGDFNPLVAQDPIAAMMWLEFEAIFESQYFPESYRDQLREKFEKLEQGSITVTQYSVKFQALSRFAPNLVSSEERKCKQFEKEDPIAKRLPTSPPKSVPENKDVDALQSAVKESVMKGSAVSELQKRFEISGSLSSPKFQIVEEMEDREFVELASRLIEENAIDNEQISHSQAAEAVRNHWRKSTPNAIPLKELSPLLCDYQRLIARRYTTKVGPNLQSVEAHSPRKEVYRFYHMRNASQLRMGDIPKLLEEYKRLQSD